MGGFPLNQSPRTSSRPNSHHPGTQEEPYKKGSPAIYKGSVMKVLERQGDTWKTSLHTWNIAQ
jgi:hypothetical protein